MLYIMYSRKDIIMVRHFCIDTKLSGLDYRRHCILSIGIIEIMYKENIYYPNHSRKLYLELKPQNTIDLLTINMHGLNINNLIEYGINTVNAVREINKYLDLHINDTAIFISYSTVDKIFFDQLFYDCNHISPFDHNAININSLAIGKFHFDWDFTETQLLKILGLYDFNIINNNKNNTILRAKEFCGIMNFDK